MPPSSNPPRPSQKLARQFALIEKNTLDRLKTLPRLKVSYPSLDKLRDNHSWPETAVVLGRGPSLFQNDYFKTLKKARERGKKFFLACADGALAHCLENNMIPDFCASVDPSVRIMRWFGDTEGATDQDQYFLKDRDAPKNKKALYEREKIIQLVDEAGPQLKIAFNIYTHPSVLKRLEQIGAELYQFIPLCDDFEYMRFLAREHPGLLGVNAGGNVGSTSYSICQFLGARKIGLCAIDFGYPPGTPLEQTQFFDLIAEHPELKQELFVTVKNPHLKEAWFTDKVYYSYWFWLRGMARQAVKQGIHTVNCSQGGVVYGAHIGWDTLERFLRV